MTINKCLMNMPRSLEHFVIDFSYNVVYSCKKCTQLRIVTNEELSFVNQTLEQRWQEYMADAQPGGQGDIWAREIFEMDLEDDRLKKFNVDYRLKSISIVVQVRDDNKDFMCAKCRMTTSGQIGQK